MADKHLKQFMDEKFKKYPTFIDLKYNWQQFKKSETGYNSSHLYIKYTNDKGWGVFTNKEIKEGEIIDYGHCAPIETPNRWMYDRGIKKYSYWDQQGGGLIALGYGSIYNCAERDDLKNASFAMFKEDLLIVFVAQRDIQKDEEILTWWGEGYYQHWCTNNQKKPVNEDL
jgi:hypothetical protein